MRAPTFFSVFGEILRSSPQLSKAFGDAMNQAMRFHLNNSKKISKKLEIMCNLRDTRLSWRQNKWQQIKPPRSESIPIHAREIYERQFTGAKYAVGESKK